MKKTAEQLMEELNKDPKFLEQKRVKDKKFSKLHRIYKEDEKDLVDELKNIGFKISSVWDFVNISQDYSKAENILVHHLHIKHHPRVLSGIVRSLAVEDFQSNDILWDSLMFLYKETPSDFEIAKPEERGLKHSIAIALEILFHEKRRNDLEKLIQEIPKGDGIDLLKIMLNI